MREIKFRAWHKGQNKFIKKKIFDAYYFNFNLKKLIPFLIFFVGIGYFLNSYKNTLEALNNKSILIRGAEMDSISELKNSTLEISNKEGKIKWKVDKNLKIITMYFLTHLK